jgi:hypothetical protein
MMKEFSVLLRAATFILFFCALQFVAAHRADARDCGLPVAEIDPSYSHIVDIAITSLKARQNSREFLEQNQIADYRDLKKFPKCCCVYPDRSEKNSWIFDMELVCPLEKSRKVGLSAWVFESGWFWKSGFYETWMTGRCDGMGW